VPAPSGGPPAEPQGTSGCGGWTAGSSAPARRCSRRPPTRSSWTGYGERPVTTVELWERLRRIRPDVEVVGVEIDPERVAAAAAAARPGLGFVRGGFELGGLPAGRRPVLVRAMNVLRQYDEPVVALAWARLVERLAPGGLLVEGTCDELGRRACWVVLQAEEGTGAPAPLELVCSALPAGLERPSDLAERLPKALIHRNVPGEPVHALLSAWDRAYEVAAPWAAYGPRPRWVQAAELLRAAGWPLTGSARRWRQGEVSVAWEAVAPQRRSVE